MKKEDLSKVSGGSCGTSQMWENEQNYSISIDSTLPEEEIVEKLYDFTKQQGIPDTHVPTASELRFKRLMQTTNRRTRKQNPFTFNFNSQGKVHY